jgi:hypothetical protein
MGFVTPCTALCPAPPPTRGLLHTTLLHTTSGCAARMGTPRRGGSARRRRRRRTERSRPRSTGGRTKQRPGWLLSPPLLPPPPPSPASSCPVPPLPAPTSHCRQPGCRRLQQHHIHHHQPPYLPLPLAGCSSRCSSRCSSSSSSSSRGRGRAARCASRRRTCSTSSRRSRRSTPSWTARGGGGGGCFSVLHVFRCVSACFGVFGVQPPLPLTPPHPTQDTCIHTHAHTRAHSHTRHTPGVPANPHPVLASQTPLALRSRLHAPDTSSSGGGHSGGGQQADQVPQSDQLGGSSWHTHGQAMHAAYPSAGAGAPLPGGPAMAWPLQGAGAEHGAPSWGEGGWPAHAPDVMVVQHDAPRDAAPHGSSACRAGAAGADQVRAQNNPWKLSRAGLTQISPCFACLATGRVDQVLGGSARGVWGRPGRRPGVGSAGSLGPGGDGGAGGGGGQARPSSFHTQHSCKPLHPLPPPSPTPSTAASRFTHTPHPPPAAPRRRAKRGGGGQTGSGSPGPWPPTGLAVAPRRR